MDVIYLGRFNKSEILTGPEKVAKRIFYRYTKENKSVFIEYFFDGEEYGIFRKLFGKEKVCNSNGSDVLRLGIFTLFTQLIKIKPGIIHIISFERFAVIAFLYRVFFNAKIIYNVHGLAVHENKYFVKTNAVNNYKDCFIEDIFIKYSDNILLLSKGFKMLLDKYYSVSKRKIKYIKNGVDEEFRKNEKKMSAGDKLKLVFISDIKREEKGFDFLKETLEKLNREVELHVVDSKDLKNKISFKNDLICFYSYDKMNAAELSQFLKGKDVFISSASYEPFGMTSAECISAGLVPVLTGETGASELITNELNGFIYEYGNSEQLNNILKRLIDDAELLKRISVEASKIYEKICIEKIFMNYQEIYREILN